MKRAACTLLTCICVFVLAGCDTTSPGADNAPYIAGLGPAVSLSSARKTIAAAGGSLTCKADGPVGLLSCVARTKHLGTLPYGPVDVSLVAMDTPDSLVKQVVVSWHITQADSLSVDKESLPSLKQGFRALGDSYSLRVSSTEDVRYGKPGDYEAEWVYYSAKQELLWETCISISTPKTPADTSGVLTVSMTPGIDNEMFAVAPTRAIDVLKPPPPKP